MPGAGRLGPARDRLTLRPRRADPLPPDRQAITKLHRRLDVEAIDITIGRTDRAAAVPRLAQLVPPARVDLVDEVLSRVGRKSSSAMGLAAVHAGL